MVQRLGIIGNQRENNVEEKKQGEVDGNNDKTIYLDNSKS